MSERASLQKTKAAAPAPLPAPPVADSHQAQAASDADVLSLMHLKFGNRALQRAIVSIGLPALMLKHATETSGNAFEIEADRVADEVLRMTDAQVERTRGPDTARDQSCLPRLKVASAAVNIHIPRSVRRALASPGRALDAAMRAFMEPRFDRDLSAVRIHTDSNADLAARDLGALAFALGPHLVFRTGRYAPHSAEGRRLLAHELTHVLQQSPDNAARGGALRSAAPQLQLTVDPEVVAHTPDPVSAPFEGWAFYRVGPTYPSEPDLDTIRTTIVRYGGIDAERLRQSTAQRFEASFTTGGRHSYWAFLHSLYGAVARLGIWPSRAVPGQFIIQLHMPRPVGTPPPSDAPVDGHAPVGVARESADADHDVAEPGITATAEAGFAARIGGNNTLLAGHPELSSLYLLLMQHFTSLTVTDAMRTMASTGLTEAQLLTIIDRDPLRARLTALFTQGWTEFRSAGGGEDARQVARFGSLIERILEQHTRGNVLASANLLRIGYGIPESDILGIVQRNTALLLYDELGNPMRSAVGLAWRDHGFIGRAVSEAETREGMARGGTVTRREATDRLVVNLFAQALGAHDTVMVAQAVEVAMRHVREVSRRVDANIGERVRTTVGETLATLILFMVGHGLARFLMRSGNPYAVAVGVALEVTLRGLGLIMGIDFVEEAMAALLESAFHLSRVREDSEGHVTALSEMHLDQAARPVSDVINYTAAVMTAAIFAGAVRSMRGSGAPRGRWSGSWQQRTLMLTLLLETGRGVREGIGAESFEGYGSTSPTTVEAPRSGSPAPEVPGSGGPAAPEAVAPEARAPEAAAPEAAAPEAAAPEARTPASAPSSAATTVTPAAAAARASTRARTPVESVGQRLVRMFLADPGGFDAPALTPEQRREMLDALMRDPRSYRRMGATYEGDTLLTQLVEEAAARQEAARAATAPTAPAGGAAALGDPSGPAAPVTTPAAAPESAAALADPVPLDRSLRVTVNINSGIYYPPGTVHYGTRGTNWTEMTVGEAEAARMRRTRVATRRTVAPSGVYSTTRPSAGEPRVVLRAWLGWRQARAGLESFMRSAGEYAVEVIQGWQRAHASGAGLGAESGEAIRIAPEFVNQALQNRGIEQFLRDLRDMLLPEGAQIHVTTEVQTQPRTLRLQSIEYRIEVARQTGASLETLVDVRIEVTPEGNSRAAIRLPGSDVYTYTPEFRPDGATE